MKNKLFKRIQKASGEEMKNHHISKKIKKVSGEEMKKTSGKVTLILAITLFIAFIAALKQFNWITMFTIIVIFILMCLPRIIGKFSHVDVPVAVEIYAIVFIYATLFLGEFKNYYDKYWWWDIVIHSSSALTFGVIGFMILFFLYKSEKLKASPKTIAMFAFSFALAIGALWEIVEFVIDSFMKNNHMQGNLKDTMLDLIVDSIGALVSSVAGHRYLKGKEEVIVKPVMKDFKKHNPKLFKKIKNKVT